MNTAYKLTNGGWPMRVDGVCVNPEANKEYLDWLADGNTPDPADPTTPLVPDVVTMRQARLALLQAGLLAQVNTSVAAADEATKITWEFSSEVRRDNALVATLGAELALTTQQLDDLFTLAGTL